MQPVGRCSRLGRLSRHRLGPWLEWSSRVRLFGRDWALGLGKAGIVKPGSLDAGGIEARLGFALELGVFPIKDSGLLCGVLFIADRGDLKEFAGGLKDGAANSSWSVVEPALLHYPEGTLAEPSEL